MNAAAEQTVGFSLVLAAARLILAALLLAPNWRKLSVSQPSFTSVQCAIAAGVALAIHFAAWITSLAFTSIAASTALVTTNPVWVAVLSWVWFKAKPTRKLLIGTGVALVGGLLVGLGGADSAHVSRQPLLGNGLALVGAWAASFYLLLGREAQHQGLSISHYITIAYSTAAIVLLPLPWLAGASYANYSMTVYGYMLLTALIPQLVGHTTFNWVVRWLPATVVTLIWLFEPVLSSGLAFILFGEIPETIVLFGALVLLLGVAIAVSAKNTPSS
jgi:drug/metabolite transporter (DMT)-like permease